MKRLIKSTIKEIEILKDRENTRIEIKYAARVCP